jgi:NIMA (never in mitosis gene a)-related kinase
VTFNRAKEELQHREALVQEKAAALKQLNTELAAKEAALAERERISRERELAVDTREQNVLERENVVRENHLRVNQGMEMLRQGWANIREEKERLQATSTVTSTQVVAAQVTSTQTTDVEVVRAPAPEPPMTRPPLEERKTVPVSSRFTRHPSYEDTPSKIPFPSAFASPTPLDSRLNSKLSVLAKRRGSNASSSLPRRLASKSLTNLVARARADAEEEFLMPLQSTPARKGPPGTPNRHIAGRTSIGSPGELERVFAEDITMATASFAGSPSILPSPFHARPRKSFSEDGLELIAHLPPTLIPAPTFIYRPEGTPAKWSAEDPDCPSPFIRRSGGAPLLPGLTIPPHTLAPAIKSATERERPPLSSINSQPAVSALEPKSGGSGSRKIPRSRSGSLHRGVLRHNAVRSTGDASALATSPTSATTPRDFMPSKEVSATPAGPPGSTGLAAGLASLGTLGGLTGGAVRSRVLVGRDPARC